MFSINIKSSKEQQLIEVTDQIGKLAREQGLEKSACLVFVPHTTAAVTINENADPDVKADIITGLDQVLPALEFKHREGNSEAHIKASLLGASEIIPVQDGKLILGTWQGIFFAEFDGPRSRKMIVSFL